MDYTKIRTENWNHEYNRRKQEERTRILQILDVWFDKKILEYQRNLQKPSFLKPQRAELRGCMNMTIIELEKLEEELKAKITQSPPEPITSGKKGLNETSIKADTNQIMDILLGIWASLWWIWIYNL